MNGYGMVTRGDIKIPTRESDYSFKLPSANRNLRREAHLWIDENVVFELRKDPYEIGTMYAKSNDIWGYLKMLDRMPEVRDIIADILLLEDLGENDEI